MNGKIIVVTHKDYQMPEDELYVPICVGSGIPSLENKFQPDNTGENISEKNSTYCELTAVYWAWKNLNLANLDYVGVSHYRRHFSKEKNARTIDKAITSSDIAAYMGGGYNLENTVFTTPKRTYISSIETHYIKSLKGYEDVHTKDIERLKKAIHMQSPDYDEAAAQVLSGKTAHMLNMFIMGSRNFDKYCEWLFAVIDCVVDLSRDRSDQKRYAGALSEFCLDIWMKKNGLNVIELPLLETEHRGFFDKVVGYVKRKI